MKQEQSTSTSTGKPSLEDHQEQQTEGGLDHDHVTLFPADHYFVSPETLVTPPLLNQSSNTGVEDPQDAPLLLGGGSNNSDILLQGGTALDCCQYYPCFPHPDEAPKTPGFSPWCHPTFEPCDLVAELKGKNQALRLYEVVTAALEVVAEDIPDLPAPCHRQ